MDFINFKKNKLKILLALIFILLFSINVFAEVKIDIPNILTEKKLYKATLILNEPTLLKYLTEIRYDTKNCNIILKKSDQSKLSNFGIDPKARSKISFYVIGDIHSADENTQNVVASIHFRFIVNATKLQKDYHNKGFYSGIGAEYTRYFGVVKSKPSFILPNIPNSKNRFECDQDIFRCVYQDNQKSNSEPVPMLLGYYINMNDALCFQDDEGYDNTCYNSMFSKEDIENGKDSEGNELKPISMLGGKGYYTVSDDVGRVWDVTDNNGKHMYNIAKITLNLHLSVFNRNKHILYTGSCKKEADVKEGNQDSFASEAISDCKNILSSFKRKAIGSSPNLPKDKFIYNLPERKRAKAVDDNKDNCNSDSDCENNLFCNACGKCVKKVIDPKRVELKIKLENKLSSKSIPNSIRAKCLITTRIKPEFSYNGKKINYCDIGAPGIKKELAASIKNKKLYSGFVLIGESVLEKRTRDEKIKIDFSKKPLEYHFLIRPNDRKKIVGSLKDVSENIEIRVDDLAITNEELTLKPIDFDLEIKSSGKELQQGSNKLIKIIPKSRYAKDVFLKASLIGPGKISSEKSKNNLLYFNTKIGDTTKIMYFAPKMGNFDIGKELASLSMVNLQKAAAKQIAEDAVLAYGGDYFQSLEDVHDTKKAIEMNKAGIKALSGYFKRNPGKYNPKLAFKYIHDFNNNLENSKKLDLIAKSYKLYTGIYGLKQLPQGVVDMRDDISESVNAKKQEREEKTWTESISEKAVVGIDIAQTAVSILTFVPNKIPVLGKVTAAGKTAFSAMTNIWKANFKYIATDEKIARAKEKFYPIMILITGEDESGWSISKGYIIEVAYHEI